jgi:hypothetical protein
MTTTKKNAGELGATNLETTQSVTEKVGFSSAPDDSITTSADAERNKAITTTTTSATEETTHDAIHYDNG